ncbi:MAG: metallopeptidase TldD-related protein [bacterium]|nr:metallopeptidase TldD-related protein [bacterium]
MNKIIEIAKQKGVEAEVLLKEDHSTSLSYQNGRLEEVTKRNIQDFSLRIIKDSKTSAVYGSKPKNAEKLVSSAIELSKNGSPAHFKFSDAADVPNLKMTSGKTKKLNIKDLQEFGEDLISRLKKFTDVEPDLGIAMDSSTTQIKTTSGANLKNKTTTFSASVLLKIPESASGIYTYVFDKKPQKIKDVELHALATEYKYFKKKIIPETGILPVYFYPGTFSSLIYAFICGISGENLVKKISPLENKIGEKIFSSKLTIEDNPLISGCIHSVPFDDEGVPTTKKYLIEKGVLKSFINDLNSAEKLKQTPTGNGFKHSMFGASISTPPSPFTTSIYVEPGDKKEKEIIKGIDKGLYVKQFLGFHSNDYIQGKFSVTVGIGYYIEKGKIRGALDKTMISGNIYDVLKNVAEISKDVKDTHLGRIPGILCEKVNVSGK